VKFLTLASQSPADEVLRETAGRRKARRSRASPQGQTCSRHVPVCGELLIFDTNQQFATDRISEHKIQAHAKAILKVVFLDDGERLVSVSADKTVRICSAVTGECVRVFEGHSGEVNSVAIASDNHRMISASEDGTLRIWDVDTGSCQGVLRGHSDIVWRVAVSPDCRIVASGAKDNTVRLWDLRSNECLHELPHPNCVAAVAFSPEGSDLVVVYTCSYHRTKKGGQCTETRGIKNLHARAQRLRIVARNGGQ
jgi:WD40 repeat protein